MFRWLKSLFTKQEDYNFYRPSEQQIYRYFDGQKVVSSDPMILYKKLMEVGPDLAVDIQVSESTLVKNYESIAAQNKVQEKIRKIFNVKSFVDGGLTEAKAGELLDHFLVYTEIVKKNSSQSLT